MSTQSKIEWTHHTFNPWWGCDKVSPGCKNCYAEALAKRFGQSVWGRASPRRFFGDKHWREPLRWDSAAARSGERHLVFCASMADAFERHAVAEVNARLNGERARLYSLIEETKNLVWLLLTKRPENIMEMAPERWRRSGAPANVWLGCTAENQELANKRIPELMRVAAALRVAVRFVSYEPALGPVDFTRLAAGEMKVLDALRAGSWSDRWGFVNHSDLRAIDWVIVGGESGSRARPFDIQWARDTVAACKAAGVPVFVKQLGSNPDVCRLRHRKGADTAEWPEDLRVREWPEVVEFEPAERPEGERCER